MSNYDEAQCESSELADLTLNLLIDLHEEIPEVCKQFRIMFETCVQLRKLILVLGRTFRFTRLLFWRWGNLQDF